MFDRYTLFRRLLGMTSEFGAVTDARMKNVCGDMEVRGVSGGTSIEITVSFREAEATEGGGETGGEGKWKRESNSRFTAAFLNPSP